MITIKGVDPRMIANNLIPFEASHPGEFLKEELQERKISQKQFAETIGVPYTALNEILNAKRPMTMEFSMLVEAALGIDAEWFVNLQAHYNKVMAKKNKSLFKRLAEIRKLAAAL